MFLCYRYNRARCRQGCQADFVWVLVPLLCDYSFGASVDLRPVKILHEIELYGHAKSVSDVGLCSYTVYAHFIIWNTSEEIHGYMNTDISLLSGR